jgi:thioredoxin-like negative regulator of GroEL
MSYAKYKDLGPKVKKQVQQPSESKPSKEPEGFKPLEIQDALHRKKIIRENKIVCIKLHADWCVPCKKIAPQYAEMAQYYYGKCTLVKEDVDLGLTTDHDVNAVPMFIFYKNGKPVAGKDDNLIAVMGGNLKAVGQILDRLLDQDASQ